MTVLQEALHFHKCSKENLWGPLLLGVLSGTQVLWKLWKREAALHFRVENNFISLAIILKSPRVLTVIQPGIPLSCVSPCLQ